ncbi:hypothetical protein FQR65_LT20664 [Abscondita terminalis]|nr:hypothetical protein FQR65_LT20664 [Abscondita terminalis]
MDTGGRKRVCRNPSLPFSDRPFERTFWRYPSGFEINTCKRHSPPSTSGVVRFAVGNRYYGTLLGHRHHASGRHVKATTASRAASINACSPSGHGRTGIASVHSRPLQASQVTHRNCFWNTTNEYEGFTDFNHGQRYGKERYTEDTTEGTQRYENFHTLSGQRGTRRARRSTEDTEFYSRAFRKGIHLRIPTKGSKFQFNIEQKQEKQTTRTEGHEVGPTTKTKNNPPEQKDTKVASNNRQKTTAQTEDTKWPQQTKPRKNNRSKERRIVVSQASPNRANLKLRKKKLVYLCVPSAFISVNQPYFTGKTSGSSSRHSSYGVFDEDFAFVVCSSMCVLVQREAQAQPAFFGWCIRRPEIVFHLFFGDAFACVRKIDVERVAVCAAPPFGWRRLARQGINRIAAEVFDHPFKELFTQASPAVRLSGCQSKCVFDFFAEFSGCGSGTEPDFLKNGRRWFRGGGRLISISVVMDSSTTWPAKFHPAHQRRNSGQLVCGFFASCPPNARLFAPARGAEQE